MNTSEPIIYWQLPKIDNILDKGFIKGNSILEQERISTIESAFMSFGLSGRIVEVLYGPIVTWFCVEVNRVHGRNSENTRISFRKINNLSVDLAIALAVTYVQVEAPIPGKGYVGVGVPNEKVFPVVLRDIIESESFVRLNSSLRLGLGVDIFGNPISADLMKFPNLLISGTTNSGKSMCVNAILVSFLINNTPDDLRIILIDPKSVELTRYNGIPHLLSPVVVEVDHVIGALQWATREMDKRYHLFSQIGARNIQDYNERMAIQGTKKLPYLLIVIDEIAEIMPIAQDEIEQTIIHLTQMGNKVGIHMILSTNRPSVDVISSSVKTNFPARIAFAVTSATDSHIILDQPGAEKLVGHGDMLFLTRELVRPLHIQGVYIEDFEQQRLVSYWRQQPINRQ